MDGPRGIGDPASQIPHDANRDVLLAESRALEHQPRGETMRDKLISKLRVPALALIVAAPIGLAGCGGFIGNEQAATTPTTLAITATEAGKRLRLSVPKSVPAGLVTVELTNSGKAFHEAQLVRLDPGHTPHDALRVIAAEGAPTPDWIHVAGGTGPASPGGKRSATQRLRPGNYIVYDAPFQNEGKGLKFGLASFKVVGEPDDSGELPKAVAKIEAHDYGFRASGLTVGKNMIEFSNTGTEPHHVIAVPYKRGATLAKLRKAFRQTGGAEAPLDFANVAYTARIDGGAKQITELDLDKPGTYALLCFVSDRKGGPPHVALGMIAETRVR
jgi:plastocyanin